MTLSAAGASAALLLSLMVGAAPADKVIPHPGGGPALIVPSASPVKFKGFDKDGVAHFRGRFELRGAFTYGCEYDCEGSAAENSLSFELIPDADLAKRLPHWQERGDGMVIYIANADRLESAVATRQQEAALLSGKLAGIRGRISITVDDYTADFGCDYSPAYSARFVALKKPPKLAQVEIKADFGCA